MIFNTPGIFIAGLLIITSFFLPTIYRHQHKPWFVPQPQVRYPEGHVFFRQLKDEWNAHKCVTLLPRWVRRGESLFRRGLSVRFNFMHRHLLKKVRRCQIDRRGLRKALVIFHALDWLVGQWVHYDDASLNPSREQSATFDSSSASECCHFSPLFM